MSNCSLTLDKDKLPKIINKVEFFMFRAIEKQGTDFFSITGENKRDVVKELLKQVKDDIIPSYIKEYTDQAAAHKAVGDEEQSQFYQEFAANLENMLMLWDKVLPNFIYYSSVFNIKNKFTLDADGLVDLTDVADDDEKMYKMMGFDQAANEVDPLDEIDQVIELYIRSLTQPELSDEYGFTVGVNYSQFVQTMFQDVKNATTLEEMIERLKEKEEQVPQYAAIIDKLTNDTYGNYLDTSFKIKFRNSFAKAFIPIYMVSAERRDVSSATTIKVLEAANGRRSFFEQVISTNFMLNGMEVSARGRTGNLGVQRNGVWMLDKTSIPKIKLFIEKAPAAEMMDRKIELLKGIGFQFTPQAEVELKRNGYLSDAKYSHFNVIYRHLLNLLEYKEFVTNPYNDLKTVNIPFDKKLGREKSPAQNNTLLDIIQVELKNNPLYNVENSVLNAEGNRQNTVQAHSNFSIVTKMLSDHVTYPRLQDILEKEPSAFWMDPQENVAIRNSVIMNSLFFLDPESKDYGKRRRVTKDANGKMVFSATEGEYVQVDLVNTGGLQSRKMVEGIMESENASSVKLSDIEKILQDMNSLRVRGYNSVLRLSDKSTDLGLSMNYYMDAKTGAPVKRLFDLQKDVANSIFQNTAFLDYIKGALVDIMSVKFLAKQGFLKDLKMAGKNISSYSALNNVLSDETKSKLDKIINDATEVEDVRILLEGKYEELGLNKEIGDFFESYAKEFSNKLRPTVKLVGGNSFNLVNSSDMTAQVNMYLAQSFIMDLEQMKMYFGDSMFFKDFHKRSSKDSATGTFTIQEEFTIKDFNDRENPNGIGVNTNLGARMLIDRLVSTNQMDRVQAFRAGINTNVNKTFKSVTLQDVNFNSKHANKIQENVNKLLGANMVTPRMKDLYEKSLKGIIEKKYNGTEADGQGKCTFDFYRIMSILTNQWTPKQEEQYRKIVMHDHFDRLADATTDENLKATYIQQRDAVGYDPLEQVYFPPKKFQYAGPMDYRKMGAAMNVPIFDKFSLQPLIPTITKNTPDDHLLNRMMINGVGYAKYESGSKTEMVKTLDSIYDNYDPNNPGDRTVRPFSPSDVFASEHTLFFNHLKEQVTIDAEIHDHAIFGSQIRKLIMMNIESPEMFAIYDRYKQLISDTVELEKTQLFNELGVMRDGDRLKIADMNKLVDYFFKEIEKKNQDNNVRKALKWNETTGQFEIPLDAAVQAQVIEGIIISAINNRVVRYKTNGSMLVQVAITGHEPIQFNKESSDAALKTFGSDDLSYYDVVEENGKPVVKAMEVKIALTGQWLKLLELNHPDFFKIGSLERLNEALKNDEWRKKNEKALRMVAYRIPTQGRNFSDVMTIKQFLPAAFGDAIIMPSEVVIKSGSDFDIDKMFVFYPNLDKNGKYIDYAYGKQVLREDLEKKKDEVVREMNIVKNYRDMTLSRLQDDYRTILREFNKALKLDQKNRAKLDEMIRQVAIGLNLMNAEDQAIRQEFRTAAMRNESDDSYLNRMIQDSIIYNVDEYMAYQKETGINVLNPLHWIDVKREGLNTLLEALSNLRNQTLTEKGNAEMFQREMITEFKDEIASELNQVRNKLYNILNIKGNIQNKLYDVMADAILHPGNYIELVTPSDPFMIMPIIDDLYKRLGKGVDEKGRHLKTDYTHTDILDRWVNAQKFQSLLKGKSDLGIAAVANTLNVMLQLSKASANPKFFTSKNIKTFFSADTIQKTNDVPTSIDYSQVYDEEGFLKSEFYSEFISSFVDAAKDDYVFAINVVTELSPLMFYMKYMGLSTEKILYFVNQPAIRAYIKSLMEYDNEFVKLANDDKVKPRQLALEKIITELVSEGDIYDHFYSEKSDSININRYSVSDYLANNGYDSQDGFSADKLKANVRPDASRFNGMSKAEKMEQVAYLLEMLNLKEQSSSITELQKAINFDTKPYSSGFDAYARAEVYRETQANKHVLSAESVASMRKESMISPLNVAREIAYMLEELFPIRNNVSFNNKLLTRSSQLRNDFDNKKVNTIDDQLKYARTAKNDVMNYVVQNFFSKSSEGMAYFRSYFNTEKGFNEYLAELITTDKLKDSLRKIKKLSDYAELVDVYKLMNNIVMVPGENNQQITGFKIIQITNNTIDKNSATYDFERLVNIVNEADSDLADFEMIRQFARDLALYSMFQSGMNKSDMSYTDITPIQITNTLYGYAAQEFNKLSLEQKKTEYDNFIKLFEDNNPVFFQNKKVASTVTKEAAKFGKWYSKDVKLVFPKKMMLSDKATVKIKNGTTAAKEAARNLEGVYSMRPNPGDVIPGVNEKLHFGNPWSHAGYQGTIKTGSLSEAEARANGNWKGDVTQTAVSEAVDNYEKWLKGEAFQDVEPERRQWILDMVNSGRLDNRPFLYFKAGYRSHADVLVDFINSRENKEATTDIKTNPLIAAGVKTTDMYGNAGKDIQMAQESTQFIGYKSGNASISSTDKYREAWGDKANTGNYAASDVVMVSGSGLFRGVTETQIKETLSTKYKPLLEKAIAAGASFRVGNQYAKGNLSDQLIASYLKQKGYTEEKLDGYSRWSKPVANSSAFTNNVLETIQSIINESPIGWEMNAGQIEDLYKKEAKENESVEEFFKRMSCIGKIK